jgi:hypothetical protein
MARLALAGMPYPHSASHLHRPAAEAAENQDHGPETAQDGEKAR